MLSTGHAHWNAWKKSWNDADVCVLFSFTILKSLNLEVLQKAPCLNMHFFFLGSRFIIYDAINTKDHYFWGILGSHLMFLSGALPWVGF